MQAGNDKYPFINSRGSVVSRILRRNTMEERKGCCVADENNGRKRGVWFGSNAGCTSNYTDS